MPAKRIGLIGDFNPEVPAHRAIPGALALAGKSVGCEVEPVWLPTNKIALNDPGQFTGFAGLWCVPASPYANMDGALWAIQFAREQGVPFLGTCGGFQHALIEYARSVLGWRDADHAETNPTGTNLVITPLACSLVEQEGRIRLKPGSLVRRACGTEWICARYHCRFGLNPDHRQRLAAGELEFTGWDEQGDVRVCELRGHPFFLATLFQPERAALDVVGSPIVGSFLRAARASGINLFAAGPAIG